MKNSILTLALFLQAFILSAQSTTNNGTPTDQRLGFSIGYYGDRVSNQGYQLGIEKYLATTNNYSVVGSMLGSNYFVKNISTAVSLNPRIGLRHTANSGITLESHFGLGYLHRFYKYNDYSVNAQGQIVSSKKASQASVMPNFAFGLGYDFRKKANLPVVYFLRTSINYNYPNKHLFFEASYALETGIVFIPKCKKK